ncbi:WG repeat-containing protein [Stenotrophomonas sp. PD6]|uniref:WG repeat-containing protein n=1 Tax=Stenotrophomonas sp. PD6 TaxID=3368612 RepID=UPI003BA0E25E
MSPAHLRGVHPSRWMWFGVLAAVLLPALGSAQAPACQRLTEEYGLQPLAGCHLDQGRPVLDAAALARLDYDPHGLAAVYAADSFHYVTRQGRTQAVITWDNGPDYLEEGLLRGRVGPRIAYFNAALEQAVPGTFDFGWPFADGVAQVCNGCRPGTPDGDGHTPIEGGEWFDIDRHGRRVPDTASP